MSESPVLTDAEEAEEGVPGMIHPRHLHAGETRFRFLLGLAPIVVGDDSVSRKLAGLVAVAARTLVRRLMSCLVRISRSTQHGRSNFVASDGARM